MIYRRQRQQYIFGIFLAVIAVINVLFYFILTRPSQTEYATLQADIVRLQGEVFNTTRFFDNMKKTSGELDHFDETKNALLIKHLVQRNKGYSEIMVKLTDIVQHAGVKWTHQGFNQNPTPQAGLNSLSIVLPLEGNYTNIVNFIRELENSDTFFLITAISVEKTERTPSAQQTSLPASFANSAAAAATGSVSLSLTLETYFYQ